VEASKHNAHGFFSKAWLIKVKPEFVGKPVTVICKPRDDSVAIDFSRIVLNVACENEVSVTGKTEQLEVNRDILINKKMELEYTFEAEESKERDDLLENQDITAKRLEFKAIENENLKQCVEALQQANEMYRNKLKASQGGDGWEYASNTNASSNQLEQKNKEIYDLQKINQLNQQKIQELSQSIRPETSVSNINMMK
jgi:hypothetical protein